MGLCSVNDLVATATTTKTTPCLQFNSNYCTCVPVLLPAVYVFAFQTTMWQQKRKKKQPRKVQALFQLHLQAGLLIVPFPFIFLGLSSYNLYL